MMEQKAVCGL